MESDRTRWDERYRGEPMAVATPPDVVGTWPTLIDELPMRGRALDLACGTGGQSLWMARRGLDVLALDVSPAAIDLVAHAAVSAGVADRIEAQVFDADDGLPAEAADLQLIVCQRFRAVHLYGEMVERLAAGAYLCITVLSTVGHDGEPGPFHAPAGELTDAFGALANACVLHAAEGDGLASAVVSRRYG